VYEQPPTKTKNLLNRFFFFFFFFLVVEQTDIYSIEINITKNQGQSPSESLKAREPKKPIRTK
jgi:hypothetical protein